MKFVFSLIALVAFSLSAPATSHFVDGKLVPITEADQVIAITTHDSGLASNGQPKLIVAAWPDGNIIWSENKIKGGAPYSSAKIDKTMFTELVDRLNRDGYFSTESLSHAQLGPDSEFTSVYIKNDKQKLKMQSWHELFESSGKAVCTSAGVEKLEGTRLDMLAADEIEYVHYRLAWAELRLAVAQLIPDSSKPAKGDIHMEHGIMSWNPNGS